MKIFCIEQNYLSHKRERQEENSSVAGIFLKDEKALLPKGNDLNFQEFATSQLFAQCEIVIKISADGQNILEEEAGNYYDVITTGINFTKINIQDGISGVTVQWEEAKAWQHSSAIGEWFSAADFKNKEDINFCVYQNREMGQMANTELMIWNFNQIISMISSKYALQKDDIIFTGAPIGICELFDGDKLEAFLEDDSALEFEIIKH